MKKVVSMAIILCMVLSGCSSGGKKADEANVAAVQEYSTVYSGEISTLNYLITANENEFAVAANSVDCLVEHDKYGVVKPSLATDWSVSEDGLVWTFNLRQNVKWVTSEGKEYAEVQAQDFVDAMQYVLNPKNNSNTSNIAYGVLKNGEKFYKGEITDFAEVGIKAKDKYVVEYTLERNTPYFLSMLTYVCFFPVNGKFLAEVGDKFGTDNNNILYNGSYIMQTFQPQTNRIFVANDSYWDKDNVFIKKLTYSYNKEADTLSPELFLRGEISSTTIPTSSIDNWMNDATKKEKVHPAATTFYTYFYALNFDPKFEAKYEPENWRIAVNNLNFRKSLFHALDKKAAMMTSEPFEPERRLSNTITPKNFVDFKGQDYTKLGELGKFAATDSFDAKEATKFKEKALSELNGKASFPVKVVMPYNTGASDWTNRAQVIKQQMENVLGKEYIEVVLLPYPTTGFLKATRRAANYGLMECNWGPDYADPETYTDPFAPSGTYNWPQLATEYKEANGKNKYENMINAAKAEVKDIEKRDKLFAEAEAFLIDQAFVIPYAIGGGGFVASYLDPFTSLYSPFGVSGNKFKAQKLLSKPINTEEYKKGFIEWEKERADALKAAQKK
ncbi:peptide ABC transporter substrate-binding protein [Clostridium sp. CS001]|uniref:peptide ABC transporter substrate-binding protein n=1 Tax=Clostridium sp. CS001 TaxID=2880648 RepID=UPI001CF218A8|nr:peptide ABC transporter substrate-binding protein [Clostridium sp. CS001]MCB2289322.1 peptide ABC transporter substrate-binding protein [Clostridium sp. CS001]